LSKPNDGYAYIDILLDLLITNFDDTIQAILQSMYLDLVNNYKDPKKLQSKALLARTLEIVNVINEYILGLIQDNIMFHYVFRIVCYNLIINCIFF